VTTSERRSPVRLRISELSSQPGLAVEGDVDFRGLDEFAAAVARAVAEHPGDIYIDLSKLTFIEVSGMRVLADASRQLASENRKLVLLELAPHLHPVLRVVGWYDSSEAG
jgi:anti-anti-sigma factor